MQLCGNTPAGPTPAAVSNTVTATDVIPTASKQDKGLVQALSRGRRTRGIGSIRAARTKAGLAAIPRRRDGRAERTTITGAAQLFYHVRLRRHRPRRTSRQPHRADSHCVLICQRRNAIFTQGLAGTFFNGALKTPEAQPADRPGAGLPRLAKRRAGLRRAPHPQPLIRVLIPQSVGPHLAYGSDDALWRTRVRPSASAARFPGVIVRVAPHPDMRDARRPPLQSRIMHTEGAVVDHASARHTHGPRFDAASRQSCVKRGPVRPARAPVTQAPQSGRMRWTIVRRNGHSGADGAPQSRRRE